MKYRVFVVINQSGKYRHYYSISYYLRVAMKYFFSAGEASGDLHAAQLIAALRKADPMADFAFLGGDMMAAEAGCGPVIHYNRMAYMGFCEVARHLPEVLGNLRRAKEALAAFRPDALILVDYPGFNLKLAKYANSLDIPVYYYISPKVWAWKEHRVKDIKRYVRKVFSILPFEVDFYRRRHDYDVEYVGNPSVEEIALKIENLPGRGNFCEAHGLPADKRLLALVPGSRRGEIRNNLPVMAEVATRMDGYLPVVAGAPGIEPEFYSSFSDFHVVEGATFELMGYAEGAMVTSGTATLEAALLGTPQVVCYRANGSRISYEVFKRVLKIPYVSLPNLIAGKEIVHEALVHLCTPDIVERELRAVLPGGDKHAAQRLGYGLMRHRLGSTPAAATTAASLLSDLSNHR